MVAGCARCDSVAADRQACVQGEEHQSQRVVRAVRGSRQPDEGAAQEHVPAGPEVLGTSTRQSRDDDLCGGRRVVAGAACVQRYAQVSLSYNVLFLCKFIKTQYLSI